MKGFGAPMLMNSRVRFGFTGMRRVSRLGFLLCAATAVSGQSPTVQVNWNDPAAPTKTTITLQVVENPPLTRSSPIHDAAWDALKMLHTDKTRLALWFPYPRLAVAELAAPTAHATSWDFNLIDPIVEDFFAATAGHSSVFTMSTIPTWMFEHADPGPIPASPDEVMWNYSEGTALRDPTGAEAADYFARIASWYTRGGFNDELGIHHPSPHHFKFAYWEVLNEPDYEHSLSIQTYTHLYDKITAAVHAVSPDTKFVGMSLAEPTRHPEAFEYFLNPANHAHGTPLDAISYHFYPVAESGESDAVQRYTFFARADAFLDSVRYIESIRKRLSPHTETLINEVGCINIDVLSQPSDQTKALLDKQYWNLCGAVFAYLYVGLAQQGIDLIGDSQLMGFPTQFPSVSLLDWNTGTPNPRYRALELLHATLEPGDRPATTTSKSKDIVAAGYVCPDGSRKVLLINKRDHPVAIVLSGSIGAKEQYVDLTTAAAPPAQSQLKSDEVLLGPFAVSVVTMPSGSN
jgi:hypothetical protein